MLLVHIGIASLKHSNMYSKPMLTENLMETILKTLYQMSLSPSDFQTANKITIMTICVYYVIVKSPNLIKNTLANCTVVRFLLQTKAKINTQRILHECSCFIKPIK